jgi:hypothetical protein
MSLIRPAPTVYRELGFKVWLIVTHAIIGHEKSIERFRGSAWSESG